MQCNRAQIIHHTIQYNTICHIYYNTIQCRKIHKIYNTQYNTNYEHTHTGWSVGFTRNNRYKCSLAIKWPVRPSSWTNSARKNERRVKEHIQFREVRAAKGNTVFLFLFWWIWNDHLRYEIWWPGCKHTLIILPTHFSGSYSCSESWRNDKCQPIIDSFRWVPNVQRCGFFMCDETKYAVSDSCYGWGEDRLNDRDVELVDQGMWRTKHWAFQSVNSVTLYFRVFSTSCMHISMHFIKILAIF